MQLYTPDDVTLLEMPEQPLPHLLLSRLRIEVRHFPLDGYCFVDLASRFSGNRGFSRFRFFPWDVEVLGCERHFRVTHANLDEVKDTPLLPPERVRSAIANGVFEGGGRCYPCESEVQEPTNLMLSHIADTYRRIVGGVLNCDAIILTVDTPG